MFNAAKGEKVAHEIHDVIIDIFDGDPDVDVNTWDVYEWADNGKVAIGYLTEAYDEDEPGGLSVNDISDLMAYVYDESYDVNEKMDILCEGAFYKHLGAVLESIHEFG